jgi:hypothetical protein
MPKLQTHCTKLTEKVRLATGRRFLTGVSQVCNSLNLWSSGLKVELTASEKDPEMFRLNQKFTDLDRKLSKVCIFPSSCQHKLRSTGHPKHHPISA